MLKIITLLLLAVLFAFAAIAGYLFRLMHWPWGAGLCYGGIAGVILSIIGLLWKLLRKNPER